MKHFIRQSVPDIGRKPRKLQQGLQAEVSQLINVAYMIFNDKEDKWKLSKEKRQAKATLAP